MNRLLQLDWDNRSKVRVRFPGEATFQDIVVVERINLESGEKVTTEVSSPLSYCINGLIRDGKHLLIGIRNSVVCFDVSQMAEVCRARPSIEGAPLEEDAVEEECLSPGGFDYDPVRRHLYMLNGYYDEAALSCYELASDFKGFRRLYRREVCGHCPRGLGDLLAAGGICVLPESDHIAAIFTLENVWVPLVAGQQFMGPARLCWVAKLSEHEDTWIEVLRPFDLDFVGDLEPMLGGLHSGVQFASAEDWHPQPVAIDKRRIAFATKTGKLLVTNLDSGDTDCVHECGCEVRALSFNSIDQRLSMETAQGIQLLNFEDLQISNSDERVPVKRLTRQPRKPKRHHPKALQEPETQLLSWSSGNPVAITADGRFAIAGRYVIDLVEMRTVCVLQRHTETIREVAITRDGSHVLTNDGIVRIFDGRTGTLVNNLTPAREYALSPCEGFLALVYFNELSVWDLCTGERRHRLEQGGSYMSWSPDGRYIAFGGWRGETQRKPYGPGLMCLNDDSVSIMSVETGSIVAGWNPGSLRNLCWTRHGLLIGIENRVENWDPLLVTKSGEFSIGHGVWRLSPEHNYLAVASNYGLSKRSNHVAATIYGLPDGNLISEIVQPLCGVTDVSIGLANDCLLLSSDRLRLYRPSDGKWVADVGPEWGRNPVTSLSAGSPRLATRSWAYVAEDEPTESTTSEAISIQENIRVWDLTEAPECILSASFRSALSTSERTIAISADGKRVAVPAQHAVLVWNVDNSEQARIELACDAGSLTALSPSGEMLAVCNGNEIHLCNLAPHRKVTRLGTHSQRIGAISFSHDSAWLVTGSADPCVKLWDLRQHGREPRTLLGAEKHILSVAYLPQLDFVLASSEDRMIQVWNAASGQIVQLLDGPPGQNCHQLLVLDSTRVAAKYGDQVWIWDLIKAKPEFRLMVDWCSWIGCPKTGQMITSWNCEYQDWRWPSF
ncbi:MAG: WD40 repeat domain-containing protein [Pirellulaceae bacterium]|nr:WD40 repeat domain-containing protein [Pirellulaceae bacterium]